MAHLMRGMVAAMVLALVAAGCVRIELVTADAVGNQVAANSVVNSLSADGTYVIISSGEPLVPGAPSGITSVYRRNVVTGVIDLVSTDTAGTAVADDSSDQGKVSADGRWVVFRSTATNLVPGDTNGVIDVFLRDMDTGTTTRVSVSTAGDQSDAHAYSPVISGDGRMVAWGTTAALVPGDTNESRDVYRRDTVTSTTILVSTSSVGAIGDLGSSNASLNFTGTSVAFESGASNLVPGDTNGVTDIFVKFVATGLIFRVSTGAGGAQANGASRHASISGNGLAIAFHSDADNLVAGDGNGVRDVFVKAISGAIFLASVADDGVTQGSTSSSDPRIDASGTVVAFTSNAPEFGPVAGTTGTAFRAIVRDGLRETTTVVSRASNDDVVETPNVVLSADGHWVGFYTRDADVIGPDTNGTLRDGYVRWWSDTTVSTMTPSLIPVGVSSPVTIIGSGFRTGTLTEVTTNAIAPGSDGVVFDNVVVVDDTTITAEISVLGGVASPGARNVIVLQNGTRGSLGLCSCLTVVP